MAAFDTPWLTHMSTPKLKRSDLPDSTASSLYPLPSPSRNASSILPGSDAAPAPSGASSTYAAFSPPTLASGPATAASAAKRRSTILVHQKSPLLLATPPQVTRALAYSHPFLLPLNKIAGLLSWSTGDPWESFLVVVAFWAVVLYGDVALRLAGPVVLVLGLIAGMYGRRFSPLSSSGWSDSRPGANDGAAGGAGQRPAKLRKRNGSKGGSIDGIAAGKSDGASSGHQRSQSSLSEITKTRHQKTLDEIVETLKEFTSRCNTLLEPALELTDFLSTQQTPTSATTRPALTTLLIRIVICTPFWIALTLPPLHIVTARRVVLVLGTVALTWHSRVMRVCRALLWRSATVRRLAALVTGLQFEGAARPATTVAVLASTATVTSVASTTGKAGVVATGLQMPRESELTKALRRGRLGHDAGVRFTFILYENQRRWVGLGWTTSLFAYERSAWTDEHNSAVPSRDKFELPEVEDGSRVRWRWAPGSRWRVDGVPDEAVSGTHGKDPNERDYNGPGGRMGWVYYDNKWQNGRRGLDGWGRWTRRRKWYRDAELVETEDYEDMSAAAQVVTENGSHATSGQSNARDLTPTPKPALPKRPSNPGSRLSTTSILATTPPASQSALDLIEDGAIAAAQDSSRDQEDEYDSGSLLSSSSRSAKFKTSSMRRRATDSSRGTASSPSTSATSRPRRTSELTGDEEDLSLGTQVDLEIQGAGKEGGSWGIGDELRMGLE